MKDGDLISKEAVIEWLKNKDIIKTKNQEENARRELAVLPSVTQPSAEKTANKININEYVKVKLTDYGKNIFYHQYDELNKIYGKEIIKPRYPKVDSDGYTSFQLWCFMNLYGSYIYMGAQNVIEPLEIVFENAEKTTLSAEKTTITDGDLISRQAVIDLLNRFIEVEQKQGTDVRERVNAYESVLWEIESDYLFPSVPSAEKTAEWIKQKSGDELFPEEIVCSKCYHSNSHLDFDEHNNPIGKVFLKSKYCPNCGAKMKGVE